MHKAQVYGHAICDRRRIGKAMKSSVKDTSVIKNHPAGHGIFGDHWEVVSPDLPSLLDVWRNLLVPGG